MVMPAVDKTHTMRSPVFSREGAYSATKDMSTALSLGSYTTRWLQKLDFSKSISKPLSSSYSQIKSFSGSFALSKLIKKLDKLGRDVKDLSQILFKGKTVSAKNLSKKALTLSSDLSSGASSVAKTIQVVDVMYAEHVKISEHSLYALGETSTYAGLVGSFIGLISCCWALVDLNKKADVSDLKKRQIEVKKSNMNLKLVSKIASVTAGILGCVSIAVSTVVLPWVVLSLNTVSYTISFTKRVRAAIFSPGVSVGQRALLSL